MAKDYYNLLGVEKTATQDEIKKAFRKQAHKYHPDKQDGDEAKFKEINEAYQILGNEEKRKQYDQFGDAAFSGQGFGGTGMGWDDFMRQAQQGGFGGGGVHMDFGDLGDIFGDMFGFGGGRSRRRSTGPTKGQDMEIEMAIEFMDTVAGLEKKITLDRTVKCGHCNGNGAEPGTKINTCSTCNGQGQVTRTQSTMFGAFQTQSPCPECKGEGNTYETKCKDCKGEGTKREESEVTIKIPSGIDNGQIVKMRGLGNAGIRGGEAGDLYVHVRVKEDKRYERDGYHVYTHEPLTISQAVLGDDITVETVHGEVTLKIPAGTQPGTKFKLKGKGIPEIQSSSKGDHIVIVEVKIPEKVNKKEKKIFEELKEHEKDSSWF